MPINYICTNKFHVWYYNMPYSFIPINLCTRTKCFLEKNNNTNKQYSNIYIHLFLKKEKSKMVMINRYFSFTAARFIIAVVQGSNSNISKVTSFFKPMLTVREALWALQTFRGIWFLCTQSASVPFAWWVELMFFCTQEKQIEKIFSFSCSQRCPLIGRHTGVETSLLVADPHPRQSLRDAPQGEGCSWHLPQVYQRAFFWKGWEKEKERKKKVFLL